MKSRIFFFNLPAFLAILLGDQYGANAKVCDTIAIAPRWVLSTASCFKDQNPAAVQSYQVERYVQHPSFSSTPQYDMALLKLGKDIPSYNPIAAAGSSKYESSGAEVKTASGSNTVTIISDSKCRERLSQAMTQYMYSASDYNYFVYVSQNLNDFICTDSCNGDKQGTALLVNGILVGMGHNSRTCFSQPGIYTRISNQAYWIQSTMNNNQASLTQGSTNNNPGYWIPVTTNNNQNTNQGWSFPDPR